MEEISSFYRDIIGDRVELLVQLRRLNSGGEKSLARARETAKEQWN